MSIQVIITDPSKTSPVELQAVIRMLQQFAVPSTGATSLPGTIAADDTPDAGRTELDPAAAFSPTGANAAAAAFGGNGAAATPGASLAMPAPAVNAGSSATLAPIGLPTVGMPAGPAAAFGFDPTFNPPVAGVLSTGLPQMPQPTTAQQGLPPGPGAGGHLPPGAVQAQATGVPGPLLDKNGDRWDERIHASTKTTTAKGVWKAKPGVDKDFAAQVLAANKNPINMSQVAQAAPLQPTPTPNQPMQVAQVAPAPQAAAFAAGASPTSGLVTFPALLGAFQERFLAGHVTPEEMQNICVAHGFADLQALANAGPQVLASVLNHMAHLLQQKGIA